MKAKRVFIDANIILNVWRREVDPKTGRGLWEGSARLLKQVKTGSHVGVMSLLSVMEVLQPIRSALQEKGLEWTNRCRQLEGSLRRYGVRFVVPDALAIADAYQYFWTNRLDPFDAILVSTAIHQNSDVVVSRDRNLRKKAEDIIPILEPEEILTELIL